MERLSRGPDHRMVPGAVEPPQLLMPRQWTPLTSKSCRTGLSEIVCPEATRCRPEDYRADLNVPAPDHAIEQIQGSYGLQSAAAGQRFDELGLGVPGKQDPGVL